MTRALRLFLIGLVACIAVSCSDGDGIAIDTGTSADEAVLVEKEPTPPPPPPPPSNDEYVIQSGDTLFTAFTAMGFDPVQVDRLVKSAADVYDLARIRVGRTIEYRPDGEGGFAYFRYDVDPENYFEAAPAQEGYEARFVAIPYTESEETLRLTLTRCLYCDAEEAGWDVNVLEPLAERVFAWDIDFYMDIREGDTLAVTVVRKDLENGTVRYGNILGATARVNGRFTGAVWFETEKGEGDYYDLDGNSMRRPFLRSPLKFKRISSGFTYRRKHPILRTVRPHLGVDFAAPPGTPVKAAADGTVILSGWNGGFGRQVKLRHANSYQTWYAHLKSIARGVRKGARVRQGQVIGYVGSTGLSTGPHLDYRMKHRGKMVNPLAIKFMPGKPLPEKQRPVYFQKALAVLEPLGLPGEVLARLNGAAHPAPADTAATPPVKAADEG